MWIVVYMCPYKDYLIMLDVDNYMIKTYNFLY